MLLFWLERLFTGLGRPTVWFLPLESITQVRRRWGQNSGRLCPEPSAAVWRRQVLLGAVERGTLDGAGFLPWLCGGAS